MKAQELIAEWAAPPTREREDAIVRDVVQYSLPIRWCAVRSRIGSDTCTFFVGADAVCVGEEDDYVRVNVSHKGTQVLLDMMGWAPVTTKMADLIHKQAAVLVLPCIQTPGPTMAHTSSMLQHSETVTARVAGRAGLISNVGKYWVLTNKLAGRPTRAANYGWYAPSAQFRGPGGMAVYQPLGMAHDMYHVDYSQVIRPVHPIAVVNGQDMPVVDVLMRPKLATLLSDEGALRLRRHPGVDVVEQVVPTQQVCGG